MTYNTTTDKFQQLISSNIDIYCSYFEVSMYYFLYLGPTFTSFAILLDPVTKLVILFIFCSLLWLWKLGVNLVISGKSPLSPYRQSVAAEPCGPHEPVAHLLFPLSRFLHYMYFFSLLFFLLVTTEVTHVRGLPPTHNVKIGTQKKNVSESPPPPFQDWPTHFQNRSAATVGNHTGYATPPPPPCFDTSKIYIFTYFLKWF